MRVLLAGNMPRDAAYAERLAQEGCEVHVAGEFQNPSLVAVTDASEGRFYVVSKVSDRREIAEVAVAAQADLFLTNSDEALANGVVDEVARHAPGMLIASPDMESSRIEWDKFDARQIIQELDDEQGTSYNPIYFEATDFSGVTSAMDFFEAEKKEVAIKPRGLSGGKGVKVMGPHLKDYDEAGWYASQIIGEFKHGGVVIEEKIEGHEFTLQGLTDGKTLIVPPATYDYPYREDGDKGPGTGGMGSFTMPPGEQLPFLADADYLEAIDLMRYVLRKQVEQGRNFKGVLYGSFFQTTEGLKLTEFNARMGDPEGLNIVELLAEETPLKTVLERIAKQELSEQDVRFKRLASTALYLVAPNYAYPDCAEGELDFGLDLQKVAQAGCRAYFGAAERGGLNQYRTVGSSRTVVITSRALTPWEARDKVHEAIRSGVQGALEYRHDVGDHDYIRIELSKPL
jgi:phosphoribosylamine--glycine ligase